VSKFYDLILRNCVQIIHAGSVMQLQSQMIACSLVKQNNDLLI